MRWKPQQIHLFGGEREARKIKPLLLYICQTQKDKEFIEVQSCAKDENKNCE